MASDQSSMSSGSRLRQFGLYRSIDARTEEFLRLSRKRQLRQGCACAAASTAITVTVVIVIFFVYEFSLNSGTNLEKSLNSGWLSLMNDTAEVSSFDPKLTKANIDRTTLKLLPLLIKAIKKNAALEKLLDDHSNISPFYDKKDSKEDFEDGYEKKSLTHSWLKMPSTKLYAIEYKTSPVVYYRDPTKNIEFYTKIRKIRDYQRVFNYVDKMISEKVYIRSSKPMQKVESNTEAMFDIMSKTSTSKPSKFLKTIPNESKHITQEKNKLRCKCPHNLGILLETLLRSIQNVSPDVSQNERQINCKNKTNGSPNITTTIDNLIKLLIQTPVKAKPLNTRTQTSKPTRTTQFKNSFLAFDDKVNLINKPTLKENESSHNFKVNQLLSEPNSLSEKESKNILEHVFDGEEGINYTSIFGNGSTIKNNMPNAVGEAMSLNDIISKKIKHITKIPIGYKKKNISMTASKNVLIKDLKVGHYTKLDNSGKEPSNKLNLEQTEDENITFDFVNSNSDTPNNNKPDKINSKASFNETINLVTLKPAYFKYSTNSQNDKTIYGLIKHSLNNYLNKTSKTTPSLKKYDNMIESYKPKVIGTIKKENKTNIYLLIENDVNAFLRKNISSLKAKLKETKAKLQKVNSKNMQQTSSTLSTLKQFDNTILYASKDSNNTWFRKNETQLSPATTMETMKNLHKSMVYNSETTEITTSLDPDDDGEFLITEITKPPENSIYKYYNDTLLHKKHQELTWEDLTNDFMPAWRSIIPEPTVFRTTTMSKPQYVEYHKADDKSEVDQEDDFSLNSNFYDINL